MQFIGHDGITTIEIDQSIGKNGIWKEAAFAHHKRLSLTQGIKEGGILGWEFKETVF